MTTLLPAAMKKNLEDKCKKAAKKVAKVAPGEKNEKRLEKLMYGQVCKEVGRIDEKLLKIAAQQLAKLGKSKSAKAADGAFPDVHAKPSAKKPGGGVPSLTLPLGSIMFDEGLGTKGKFELRIWADPKDFDKADKGVMLYFTVSKF